MIRNNHRRPSPGDGFTMIELVAVMVIVAILAASAAPALNSLANTRSSMASQLLLRDLTFARQYAVATGSRTWVVFDVGAESWSVLVENPASPGRTGAAILTDPATGKPYTETLGGTDYPGVGLVTAAVDGGSEIGFDWIGRPLNSGETDLAASGVITLTNGHQITIEVETGHVEYVAP